MKYIKNHPPTCGGKTDETSKLCHDIIASADPTIISILHIPNNHICHQSLDYIADKQGRLHLNDTVISKIKTDFPEIYKDLDISIYKKFLADTSIF